MQSDKPKLLSYEKLGLNRRSMPPEGYENVIITSSFIARQLITKENLGMIMFRIPVKLLIS